MNFRLILFCFLIYTSIYAQQNDCQYSINVKDSLGTLRETKSELIQETVFGNKSELLYLSLINNNDTPLLSLQFIDKDSEYFVPKCINQGAKLFLQLNSGEIYTLINAESQCANLLSTDTGKYTRILTVNYYFTKKDFEALKNEPLSFIKIIFSTGSKDYSISKELKSESVPGIWHPNQYLMKNFSCIE